MRKYFKGLLMAISMFTIIPLPKYEWDDEGAKNIMKFYPVIGLIVGFIWYGVYRLLFLIQAPTIIITALTMITPFLVTGMLHLDGYMDVCDALLSRRDREEKLRILKDPNTGAFAVISLAMLFIVNFSALYTVLDYNNYIVSLVIIPIISRSFMGYLLLEKEPLPQSSLGTFFRKGTGKIDKSILLIFLLLAALMLIAIMGLKGLIVSVSMVVISLLFVNNSCKELGGMSGDTAGFGLVIAEIVGLLVLAII